MNAPNFTSALDRPIADIEKPKPFPIGTYIGITQGLPKLREVGKGDEKFKVVDFMLKLTAPYKDVDPDTLAAYGDLSSARPLQKSIFYGTPEGEYELQQFLTVHLGMEAGTMTGREMLANSMGKQCLVSVKHEPYEKNGQMEIGSRVAATAKL